MDFLLIALLALGVVFLFRYFAQERGGSGPATNLT